jgi:hypothetical protein
MMHRNKSFKQIVSSTNVVSPKNKGQLNATPIEMKL